MTIGSAVVAVVPGDGILARRSGALFFSPTAPAHGRVAALLDAFEAAADDVSSLVAVTDAVVASAFDASPFAVVAWTAGLEVVVFGSVEVSTDHPALPMLSGAGSGSWVERRLGSVDGAVTVSVGGQADEHSDLVAGRVRAGGFAARVTPSVRQPSEALRPAATPAASAVAADAAVVTEVVDSGRRLEGLAALHAATGGDWMEDSLGLGPRGPLPAEGSASPAAPPVGTEAVAFIGDVDDEVTLGGDDEPLPSVVGAPPVWPGDEVKSDRDPARGGDMGGATNRATGEATVGQPAERRLVPSRQCPDDHPNPPLADVCAACGAAIDAAAPTVAIPQPVLARLMLAGGDATAIDRVLVLGRRPDATVAGMPAGSRLISVGSDAAVSRTHAVVRAEGWTVTVTDCGSRSGTAVLMPGGDEPLLLQPWIPHEVAIGAQIFLGGPTSVSIEPLVPLRDPSE